jgi:16S rRNA U516 pseudouridylate synthase RsuA-like enzyme
MSMAVLGRRLQILIDEERYRRLEDRAAAEGRPVAALVRDAIDLAYPSHAEERRRGAEAFLSLDPMPVGDWEEMKGEILHAAERGL